MKHALFQFNWLFACGLAYGVVSGAYAAEQGVSSPDGKITVVVSDAGGVQYRVDMDGQPLLKPSRLGLEFANGVKFGPTAKIEKSEMSDYDGYWDNRFGQRRVVRDRWNQAYVTLVETGFVERRFGVIVRVYDDGVAVRYDLNEASKLERFVLYYEQTEFAFAGDYRCWSGEPSVCAERTYLERKLSAIPRRDENGIYRSTLPLVVQTPQGYAAVAESDLLDWAGMFLTGSGTPTVRVALAPRGDGHGCVVSQVPRTSPWRVLMLARTAGGLLGSDLIANLATPSQMEDTSWIKPGASAWDPWWTGVNPNLSECKGGPSHGDTPAHTAYIDLAAEMGWPYQVIDGSGYENRTPGETALNLDGKNPEHPPVDFAKCAPQVDLMALLDYAKQRHVRLLVGLHSCDLDRYGIERACKLFSKWGVAGLKIDFMNSDSQERLLQTPSVTNGLAQPRPNSGITADCFMEGEPGVSRRGVLQVSQETVAWYERVVSTAARYKLLIDFHGAYQPMGLSRTWPNYITPGGFINVPEAPFKVTQPNEVMGTRAHQLAMPVIYLSPLTVFCGSPTNYQNAAGSAFYKKIPTVWDDTVVLSAEMPRHLVMARRSGDVWWVVGMTGDDALKVRIPLCFLGSGRWTLHSYADAPDAVTAPTHLTEKTQDVAAGDAIDLELMPAGGYAATLSPVK